MQRLFFLCNLFLVPLFLISGVPKLSQQQLNGAWERINNEQTEQWLFADGYCIYSVYNKKAKQFSRTMGGPFRMVAGKLEIDTEFDSSDPTAVNNKTSFAHSLSNGILTIERNGVQTQWQMIDDGKALLSGNWHITKRMQDGQLQTIHQTGTRKTVKLLTAARFQWVAIDPAAKGFYGTGGGGYTFKNSGYTEHIDFFSRDSSRVGSSLSFTGELKADGWHHSGKNSKGDELYEVWSRVRQ